MNFFAAFKADLDLSVRTIVEASDVDFAFDILSGIDVSLLESQEYLDIRIFIESRTHDKIITDKLQLTLLLNLVVNNYIVTAFIQSSIPSIHNH